jgi:hypothetical protein
MCIYIAKYYCKEIVVKQINRRILTNAENQLTVQFIWYSVEPIFGQKS